MKNLSIVLIVFIFNVFTLFSQIKVKISGNIFNSTSDSIYISSTQGNKYINHFSVLPDKKGNYTMEGTLPFPDYYQFRIGNQAIHVILKEGTNMQIYGDGSKFMQFHNIVNSDETIKLNEFVSMMSVYNYKKDSANAYLRKFPDQQEQVNQSFNPIYLEFKQYKDNFLKENQNSPALIPMLNEIDHEKEFPLYEYVVNQLVNGFGNSPTVKNVKAQFDQEKIKKDAMSFLDNGKVAPNFTQAKIDGTKMNLSDLKGNVVLIDFWASWCGPCRKENPNVVRLYEKYKNDGFTVMSVSLDKDKQAWLDAIKKDKLSWPNHVSDLKFWQNEAAKMYKVTGIPFTVLIDKEGKIINKNLRGEELEQTLKSIFGH
jgi:thiol-disulfide isomerase/thioredoxin